MPKLVAGWILGIHDVLILRVRVSLFVNIFSWTGKAFAFEAIDCWFESNEMLLIYFQLYKRVSYKISLLSEENFSSYIKNFKYK